MNARKKRKNDCKKVRKKLTEICTAIVNKNILSQCLTILLIEDRKMEGKKEERKN